MEKVISDQFAIENQVKKYTEQLSGLLSATPVKYADWPNTDKATLSKSAGIYHFFEKEGNDFSSLYVGKAGFGGSTWNLLKRLNQHFQVSQPNTLLGKIAKASNQEPTIVKQMLCCKEVYLQWLVLFESGAMNSQSIEADLIWSECFCKSILMPKYTNA